MVTLSVILIIFKYNLETVGNRPSAVRQAHALSKIEGLRYPHPSSLRRTRSGSRYKVQGLWPQILMIGE
jgi:hypothetical protein